MIALEIHDITPSVRPAISLTRSGVVRILGTTRTLSSPAFQALCERCRRDVVVLSQPCPGLADQVENGELDSPKTGALIERYVLPLLHRGVDTLVLGCTHYAFLIPLLKEITSPDVAIIDTADTVARQVHSRLKRERLETSNLEADLRIIATTRSVSDVSRVGRHLWVQATGGDEVTMLVCWEYIPENLGLALRSTVV